MRAGRPPLLMSASAAGDAGSHAGYSLAVRETSRAHTSHSLPCFVGTGIRLLSLVPSHSLTLLHTLPALSHTLTRRPPTIHTHRGWSAAKDQTSDLVAQESVSLFSLFALSCGCSGDDDDGCSSQLCTTQSCESASASVGTGGEERRRGRETSMNKCSTSLHALSQRNANTCHCTHDYGSTASGTG